jgi:bifunctional DNase/RNase
MMVPVIVESVRVNLTNGQRVVILKDEKLDRYLFIWVGINESNAIALELQNEKAPRPLTADLLKTVIDELGAHVAEVVVSELTDEVYHARIGITSAGGDRVDIDARSSDAIALAVRTDAPIFVEQDVLDRAAISMPSEEDERLDVYREFVNQLFESHGSGEGERRPDG